MDKAFFEVKDIVDSIRFYVMLSMVCKQKDDFVGDPDFQLKRFLKEVEEDPEYNKEKIVKYSQAAVESLPSEFLKIFNIDSISRR